MRETLALAVEDSGGGSTPTCGCWPRRCSAGPGTAGRSWRSPSSARTPRTTLPWRVVRRRCGPASCEATAEQLAAVVSSRGGGSPARASDAATLLLALANGLALEHVGRSELVAVDSLVALLAGMVTR